MTKHNKHTKTTIKSNKGLFFHGKKSACGKPVTRIIVWGSHQVWFGLIKYVCFCLLVLDMISNIRDLISGPIHVQGHQIHVQDTRYTSKTSIYAPKSYPNRPKSQKVTKTTVFQNSEEFPRLNFGAIPMVITKSRPNL